MFENLYLELFEYFLIFMFTQDGHQTVNHSDQHHSNQQTCLLG